MSVDPKTQIFRLGNFPQGLMSSSVNIFEFPMTALAGGQNVELADRCVVRRQGSSIMSTGSLPVGEVMALANVRFPTNEVSYLVAQVKYLIGFEAGVAPIGTVNTSIVVWDTANGVALALGGTNMAVAWQYDPTLDSWTELAAVTGGTPADRYPTAAIYVPSSESVVMFGGFYYSGGAHNLNDLWVYDCTANTWTEQSPTGDVPAAGIYKGIYRSSTDTMIVFNSATTYYELDLATWVFTEHTTTHIGDGYFPAGAMAAAYDPVNDQIVMAGGLFGGEIIIGTTWTLDFDTEVWTEKADVPTPPESFSNWQGFYCSGLFYAIGLVGGVPPVRAFRYTIATDTWAELLLLGTPPDAGTRSCITDDGRILLWDGTKFWQTPQICSASPVYGYGLYASPTPLPTTSGVFTLIWEFTSEPGVCTFGPLNDRVVITEGLSDPPLVWPGAMSNDASDWPHLLHALIAQDGIRMYDVSPSVCDKDPDTVAQVGGIRRWGAIYLCTDMPLVEGFYFDMESPNTGASGTTSSTFHNPIQIDAIEDVARYDFKGVITNWVQSSGATGHFTNGADTIALGPGTDKGAWNNGTAYVIGDTVDLSGTRYWCILGHTGHTPPNLTYWLVNNPEIVPGIAVDLGDGEFLITAVTAGGVAVAGVTLAAIHANATVTAAYGLSVSTDGMTVNLGYQAGTETWTKSLAGGASMAGYSIRIVVPGSEITTGGDHVQLTLMGYTVFPALKNQYNFAIGTTTINQMSIVERDGTTGNGMTAPTMITFPGFYGTHLNSKVLPYSGEIVTDIIPFVVDETKDYLVIIDMEWSTSWYVPSDAPWNTVQQTFRAGYMAQVAGTSYVKDFGWGNDGNSAADQTITGFTQVPFIYGLEKMKVTGINPVSAGQSVAHTSNAIQLASGTWESLNAVTITQITPGSSSIYHAISFDARATFWVFLSAAWREIVRQSGVWQYNNSATSTPSWQTATVNSLLGALRQAFAVSYNQMDKTAFEAITATQWAATNGFIPHITTALDFAVGMQASGTNVPLLSAYEITYGDTGQAIVEGFRNGAWTGGDGWTDNTIVAGNRLGQSGSILYDGATPFAADYHVIDGIPGYWFRLLTNGTSPLCAITRIRYKAPCQPLANIGDGQPDVALGVVYVDTSTGGMENITVKMSDNTLTELASALVPMATDDFLYAGYLTQFTEIEITPFMDGTSTVMTNNQATSVLSGEYWNGETWVAMMITDGTIQVTGKTLSGQGKISWSLPSDWKKSIPFDASYSRGYWVRFSVSDALTATTALSELRVFGVPDGLVKHNFVTSYANRIALGGTQRTPNQVDISRPFEEYGFTGPNAGSFVVGAQDQIACALSAWDGLFIGKTQSLHYLKEGANDFETIEAARRTPINSQVIVKAPTTGFDYGENYGLFFLNRYGAHVMVGLHTDSIKNTSRGLTLSDVLNFWDTNTYPRIDLDYLHLACGEYWPAKNWICLPVPVIFSGSDPQAANNAMMIYDLNMQAWLPLFVFPFGIASLASAYHYNANAPGKLGSMGLYAGTYDGRVIRLFDPVAANDVGTVIAGSIETGWLDFGAPELNKWFRNLYIYGKSGGNVTLTVYRNGATTADPEDIFTIDSLSGLTGTDFTTGNPSFSHKNIPGTLFKLRLDFAGNTTIYALQVAMQSDRDWPATRT